MSRVYPCIYSPRDRLTISVDLLRHPAKKEKMPIIILKVLRRDTSFCSIHLTKQDISDINKSIDEKLTDILLKIGE